MSVIEITKDNFEAEVVEAEGKVLIDFWATWCGPCMMMKPIIEELAEGDASCRICSINVDDEPELAMKFGIISIPTLAVFVGGVEKKRSVGAISREAVLSLIEEA